MRQVRSLLTAGCQLFLRSRFSNELRGSRHHYYISADCDTSQMYDTSTYTITSDASLTSIIHCLTRFR